MLLAAQDIGIFFVMLCASNWLYNQGPKLRAGPPPLDLFGPIGYLSVLYLSSTINGFAAAPVGTYAFHLFMVQRSQVSPSSEERLRWGLGFGSGLGFGLKA